MQHVQVEAGGLFLRYAHRAGSKVWSARLQFGRGMNDDGAACVQDQFAVRDFDIEDHDRVAEGVDAVLAQRRVPDRR